MAKVVMNRVFGYLTKDYGAKNLANLPIVVGRSVIDQNCVNVARVHRELVATLAPGFPPEVNMVILPDATPQTVTHLTTFLYCGR